VSNAEVLMNRNKVFAETFDGADLPLLPKFRTVIVTCGDARVDPAKILDLELGDSVVMRNNGGRVTQQIINEVGALSLLVAKVDGGTPGPFELILIQHTHCGAERFADPNLQAMIKAKTGIDVSEQAITNQEENLQEDIEKLRSAPVIPDYVVASAHLYDIKTGLEKEIVPPTRLGG
jgi:carbonic anhydrase